MFYPLIQSVLEGQKTGVFFRKEGHLFVFLRGAKRRQIMNLQQPNANKAIRLK